MKLLIIEVGKSKLPAAISAAASKMIPKPESISTMNIVLEKFNVPEFKNMLFHLSPDIIILDPPDEIDNNWNDLKWTALVREVIRHVEVLTARVVLVSSVDILGDAQLRTETAVELPYGDRAIMLLSAETMIQEGTSRYYLMRFPDTTEDSSIRGWAGTHPEEYCGANETFTLISLEDMASSIIDKVQTGWFGKYHVSPNDFLTLSDLVEIDWDKSKKIPDYSLLSRYNWRVAKSKDTWNKLVAEVKSCEQSRT